MDELTKSIDKALANLEDDFVTKAVQAVHRVSSYEEEFAKMKKKIEEVKSGEVGPQGIQGIKGEKGDTGADGKDGRDGKDAEVGDIFDEYKKRPKASKLSILDMFKEDNPMSYYQVSASGGLPQSVSIETWAPVESYNVKEAVLDSAVNAIFIAINNVTGSSIPPSQDTTNWIGTDDNQIGHIQIRATATNYKGWRKCDGSAISRTTYVRLFNLIGTAYGAGDGSTTFNLPDDPAGRALGIAGAGAGLTFRALDAQTGTETVLLTGEQSGTSVHTHTLPALTATNTSHHHGVNGITSTETGSHNHPVSDPGHDHVLGPLQISDPKNYAVEASTGSPNVDTSGVGGAFPANGSVLLSDLATQDAVTGITVGQNSDLVTTTTNPGQFTGDVGLTATTSGGETTNTNTAANATQAHNNMMPIQFIGFAAIYVGAT